MTNNIYFALHVQIYYLQIAICLQNFVSKMSSSTNVYMQITLTIFDGIISHGEHPQNLAQY